MHHGDHADREVLAAVSRLTSAVTTAGRTMAP
jgi:hypothetical protein